jgi:hypothetical protein
MELLLSEEKSPLVFASLRLSDGKPSLLQA